MSGQNCKQTEAVTQENFNLLDNQCGVQNQQALNQKDEQKSLDQIQKDHNVIAEVANKECDSLNNINIDLDYQKYLSNEEKRTLEKLQDNTQITIEKYKDIKQLSSSKKNSDISMKGCDMYSHTSMKSSQQAQSCITFYQYKTGKQNQNNKMYDSANSYQSDKCLGFISKELDQSEQLTPKKANQKLLNNSKRIQENLSHQQLQNYFEAVQQNVSKRINYNSLQDQQRQVRSLIQPQSSDEKQIAYINRREELSPKNLLKEPYFFSSGFTFEKFKSQTNPQQCYTSFKFKSDKSSSPQSKRSRSKKYSQDEILNNNLDQQTKSDQKQSMYKLQNKTQYQNSSLLNSMLQSNSVKKSLENLQNSLQNPVQLSPNTDKKLRQSNKSYKENEIRSEFDQNLQNQNQKYKNSSQKQRKHSNNNLKSYQSSAKKVNQVKENQQNEYRKSLISPSCFYFLDEISNSSILKNTLIQWFENEKIKFQNKVDQLLMNQNCLDQESSKKSKFVVSNKELDFMQNFLIDFEILLTQSNGIVNSKLETKLQEFLNSEAQIVVNRIKDKKPSTTKAKQETYSIIKQEYNLNNSQSENNLKDSQKNGQIKDLSSQAEACQKLTNIDQNILKILSNDEQIFNYSFHYRILQMLVNQINIKILNEQKFTTESNLKTSLFLAFFSFLANFFEFIPVVNQKLEEKTWEFCNNLLTKSGIIFNSIQKLPSLIEKQLYNPYLIQEFEDSFQEVENIVYQVDKLLDDCEYSFFLKLVYSIKSLFEILKNNNIINFDQKKLKLNQKKTQEYLQKREQKVKDGIQINSYLYKSVLEQENFIQQQYGVNFQEWNNNILQVQKDINTLKAKEKQHKWIEERQIKKKALEKEKMRDLDDFYRYKLFINRVSNLKNRESKRERINNSTEIRMIEKSYQKQRNKSMISEEIEKTKSEISFKQVLKKQAIEKKQKAHIEFVDNVKEKRKVREQQIEELKKAEKEEHVWKRAQQLLEKQNKLLYEREQLLQNQRFF
ncbi:hypothetical protein ABPG72_005548 [Tetrahymena utriculariae]